MTHSALQAHIESVLSRCRERDERLTRQEVEDLYTDGCAVVLSMEADRLQIKRRLDAQHAGDREDLARIDEELDSLRHLVRLLRTAVEWVGQAEAGDRRFIPNLQPPAGRQAR